jgi:hypothetical protein
MARLRALVAIAIAISGSVGCEQPNTSRATGDANYRTAGAANPWAGAPAGPTFTPPATTPSSPMATASVAPAPTMSATGGAAAPLPTPTAGMGAAPAPVVPPPPAAGTGGMGAMMPPPPPAMTTGPKPTSVTLDFTTASQGGRYSPRNVGAVWITDSAGKWIKNMEVWAFIRMRHLTKFLSVDPSGNRVDAVSSATLSRHGPHHSMWNLKTAAGMDVPDGDYSIFIECTEDEVRAGQVTEIKFTKGPMPQTVMPPDTTGYKGIKLVYQ